MRPDRTVERVQELLPRLGRVVRIERLQGGHTHRSWLIHTATERLLVKVPIFNPVSDETHRLRELLEYVNENGILCPRILALSDGSQSGEDMGLIVQEYIPGEDAEQVWEHLSEARRYEIMLDFGRAVGTLHRVRAPYFSWRPPVRGCVDDLKGVLECRLLDLVEKNAAARVISDDEISAAARIAERGIADLDVGIEPSVVHSDLYLANLLVSEGRSVCLLDYEHAKYLDPVWDFVKLHIWVFGLAAWHQPQFMEGYKSVFSHPDDMERRLYVYMGFELLAGFPYWKKTGRDPSLAEDYYRRFQEWLRHG